MLTDAESYQRFGIGGDAVAECRTISPRADRAQNDPVFTRTTAIQNKGTVHVAVGTNNEADPHAQIVIFRLQQRVGSEQGFGWADASTFWQGEGIRHRSELGNMHGHATQGCF